MLAYPLYRLETLKVMGHSAVAATLCLLAASIIFVWSHWTLTGRPERRPFILLAGSGIRMATVMGAGIILAFLNPGFQEASFWFSVLVFYLFTLTVEMVLLMAGWPRTTSYSR
jgi:hypothetical protein